ncbi:MAG: fibronectin type III domain-containing protein [Bacteroidales bacterium]|nr:fibronectin type III domain-containing protein [Bacteroidales bacterium]
MKKIITFLVTITFYITKFQVSKRILLLLTMAFAVLLVQAQISSVEESTAEKSPQIENKGSASRPFITSKAGINYSTLNNPAGAMKRGTSAGASAVIGDMCIVIIEMFDSWGDGWNGAGITVSANGTTYGTASLSSGTTGTDTILVPPATIDFTWVAGSWDSECSFNIYDGYSVLLYASAGPGAGTFFSWENTCTAPEAATINGTVTSLAGGAAIADATITYAGILGGAATTDVSGNYSIEVLAGYTYNITVEAAGYNKITETGYTAVAGTTTKNYAMTNPIIGVTPTTVEVTTSYGINGTAELQISNTGNGPLNFGNSIAYTAGKAANEAWDLVASFTATAAGMQGVATDGQYIYLTSWQASPTAGHSFEKYDLDLNFVEGFDISGVSQLRDLTYDGTYFYGGSGSTLYCLDLANQTLVSSVSTGVSTIRHCSYDPENDGFWVGNWSDLYRINRAGVVQVTGPAPESAYGSGYDDITEGGPYLLLFCQPNGSNALVYRYNIATNTIESTPIFDFAATPGYKAGTAGGAFVGNYDGKICFFGNMQQDPNLIGIYELGIAGWLTMTPSSGHIAAGGTTTATLTMDGWWAQEGTFNATLNVTSSSPNVGSVPVDIAFNISAPNCDAPTNLTAEVENFNNVILTWNAPAGNVAMYNIYHGNAMVPFATVDSTLTTYTDENLALGNYCYVVRALYNDGCLSLPTNSVCKNIIIMPDVDNIIYVTVNGAGDKDGSSWSNATPYLQLAVTVANTYNTIPQVWVAAGTYYGDSIATNNAFTMAEGVNVYGGFAGNEAANYDLSLRDFETNATVLDGQQVQRVLYQVANFAAVTTWDGFTIQNGSVSNENGGGVYLRGGAHLNNCKVINNTITGNNNTFGCGIYAYGNSTGSIQINNCEISNNSGSYTYGGGIYTSYADVTNCLISNNSSSRYGGGVYANSSSKFINCDIVNNQCPASYNGGGIYNYNYNSSNTYTNCIVWGNKKGNVADNVSSYGGTYSYCAVEGGYEGEGNINLAAQNTGSDTAMNYVAFVDVENSDFRLLGNSVCIDAGDSTSISVQTDINGNDRIFGETIDIGTCEYSGEVYCVVPIQIKISNIVGTSAFVSWYNANVSVPEYYILEYAKVDGGEWNTVTTTETYLFLSGLTPLTNYKVRMRAACSASFMSSWTSEYMFTTGCYIGNSEIIIGEGTVSQNGGVISTQTYYKYSYTQQIYTASELNNSCNLINQIYFQYFYQTNITRNISIYLGHTDKSSFTGTSDYVSVNDLTQVFSGDVTFSNIGEDYWFEIVFDTPFAYNGTNNLVIAVDDNTGSYQNNGAAKFYTH